MKLELNREAFTLDTLMLQLWVTNFLLIISPILSYLSYTFDEASLNKLREEDFCQTYCNRQVASNPVLFWRIKKRTANFILVTPSGQY